MTDRSTLERRVVRFTLVGLAAAIAQLTTLDALVAAGVSPASTSEQYS